MTTLESRPPTDTARGDDRGLRVGLVTTFPPTRCGIGKFSNSLLGAIESLGRGIDIEVVRLVNAQAKTPASPRSCIEIIPDFPIGLRAAAKRLNERDVVVLQHEYGIYGANDGEKVLDLVERVERPIVAVLHTVLEEPTPNQRRIIEELARRTHIVTLSEAAHEILARTYHIDLDRVEVVPHGAGWPVAPENPLPHRTILTWGLLGPGKGIERVIRALPAMRDLDPPPVYRVVGRTHPAVVRREGFAYRKMLEDLAASLGVEDMIEFIDTYLDDEALYDLVAGSDVVVLPYDNSTQISSGVLAEAIAAGRPVVATDFPHARELLADGAGLAVDHDDDALGSAVTRLLAEPELYSAAARAAAIKSEELSWESCARRYAEILERLASAPTQGDGRRRANGA